MCKFIGLHSAVMSYFSKICKLFDIIPALHQLDCQIPNQLCAKTVHTHIARCCNVIKGAMRFGTFKSIDFKKNWYVKVPVVPRNLML